MTEDELGHVTRGSDSSLYDEICTLCGGTDRRGDDRLRRRCQGSRQARRPIAELVEQSKKAMAAMSPVDRAILEVQQKHSFVRGNLDLSGVDKGATRDALSSSAETILMNEVLRLRANASRDEGLALANAIAQARCFDPKREFYAPDADLSNWEAHQAARIADLQKNGDVLTLYISEGDWLTIEGMARDIRARKVGDGKETPSPSSDESIPPGTEVTKRPGPRDVVIDYTNWRGERAERRVSPVRFVYSHTDWHPEAQWLLVAFDLDKQELRSFAMTAIHGWRPAQSGDSDAAAAAAAAKSDRAAPSRAAADVLAERERQKTEEECDEIHDDRRQFGEMALAAAAYAANSSRRGHQVDVAIGRRGISMNAGWVSLPRLLWPWELSIWKPKTPRHDLVRAGALILAEIERLDRLAAKDAKVAS